MVSLLVMICHGLSFAFAVRIQSRKYVLIVLKMIGICVFLFFSLATIRAQLSFPNQRTKIIWHDEKPIPNYFYPTRTETSFIEAATKNPIQTDDNIWPPKPSGLNLNFPKFLFNDDPVVTPQSNKIKMFTIPNQPPSDDPKPIDNEDPNKLNPNIDNADSKVNDDENFKPKQTEGDDQFDQKITDLQDDVLGQKQNNKDDDVIRERIFSLAKDTEKDLENKVKIIEKTNAMFKQNNYYKLGYIVSYINTTHNALTDLMKHVERNRVEWDVLKILNAYVQIKKTKEFLTEMLSVLNFLQSRQSLQSVKTDKKKLSQSIAWSYYDDA